MKNLKLKTLAKNRSINLLFRIMVRILWFSIILLLLTDHSLKSSTDLNSYYYNMGYIYYFLFLLILDRYLQYSNKKLSVAEMLTSNSWYRLITYSKWILLVITIALLVLTLMIMPMEWPISADQKILYFLTKFSPNLFGTNISFIIISMLVFYADTIANFNKKLKQEQDLTI